MTVSDADLVAAKYQLNLTTSDDDILVARLFSAAQDWFEAQLGYKLADRFTTGSPATLNIPPALYHGILLMVGHWYANREGSLVGVSAAPLPLGVCDIVCDWRDWSWGEAADD
jgi:hypothetical protein